MTRDPLLAARINATVARARVEAARRDVNTSAYKMACEAAKIATHDLLKLEVRK